MTFITSEGVLCHLDEVELKALLALMAKENTKTILEIGTCNGGSALEFVRAGCEVVSVDIEDSRDERAKGKFEFIKQDSANDTELLRDLGERRFDMLLIDADHSRAIWDFELYWRLAKTLVVFDDINWPDVRKDYIIASRFKPHLEFRNPTHHVDSGRPETLWQGIGVVFMDGRPNIA